MGSDKTDRPTINITSNYQSGGITAHTVNLNAVPQRKLGPQASQQLLREVPIEKEVVVYSTVGHEESFNLACEIYSFMKVSGYRLFGGGPMPQIFFPQLLGMQILVDERAEISVGLMSENDRRPATPSAGIKMTI